MDEFLNKVTCGNCIDLMQRLGDNSVHLTLTDIPYGEVNRKSNGLRVFDKKDADEETFDLDSFLSQVVRVTSGSVYVFCGTEQVSQIRKFFVQSQMTTRLCIWEKSNPSPVNGQHVWLSGIECCVFGKKPGATFNEHCKNTVWRYPVGRSKIHPTEKPLALFEYLVTVSSNPNDIVFDPCCGSGTTLLASQKNGRSFMGFEINPEYVKLTEDRLLGIQLNIPGI